MKTLKQIQEDIEEIEVTKSKLKNTPMPESEKIEMMKELDKYLGELEKEKSEIMFHGDWSSMRWYPKEKGEYNIRVLPPKTGQKGSWSLRVNKHFVYTYSHLKPRVIVCNFPLFGKHCSICEFEERMREEYGSDIIEKFILSTQQGVVNIVVRGYEEEGVKVWEAPKTAFNYITAFHDVEVNVMRRRKGWENVKENALYECDLKVLYDPGAKQWERYKVEKGETRPLGTEEEEQRWLGQALELLPEVLYKPVEDSETSELLDEVRELAEERNEKLISKLQKVKLNWRQNERKRNTREWRKRDCARKARRIIRR